MNWSLLQNSLVVSALATLLAGAFGVLAALWLAGLPGRARWLALALAGVAFALPAFLVTNCWLHLLGNGGVWRGWLPLNVFSLGGTVWLLALLHWPLTLLFVLGAWQRVEPAELESDPALTGAALVRWLLWPRARGALAQAAVLTFVLALNNFSVPALLQTKVFPAELWVSFNTTFDTAAALRLSVPLVLAPLLLLLWLRGRPVAWAWTGPAALARAWRRQLGPVWHGAAGVVTVAVLALSAGLPLAQLLGAQRTWSELFPALAAGQSAAGHSLGYAAATATFCVAAGLATWRWPIGLGLWLTFLAPGVLLGIGLIAALNRPWSGGFYQSAGLVLLAYALRYLAPGWNAVALAMRGVDRDQTDAAALSGAGAWTMLRQIHWPQIAPQLAAAWYVTYLLCLWDVETLVLIVPPGGETLALRIFNLLHYGHNSQVNALCLLLLALAVLPPAAWGLARLLVATSARRRTATQNFSWLALLATVLGLVGCGAAPTTTAALDSRLFSRAEVIGTRGTGVGQFNKPRSVAVDARDHLFAVDTTGRVQKFSPAGDFLLSWQMPQTEKGKPKGMDRDGDGNVVLIEPHYFRVNHFSPEGKLITQWGPSGTNAGQLSFPRGVAVNSRGELLVSEYGLVERVQRFSARGGQWLGAFGHAGAGPGEFNRAEGLGVDAQDRIYVADSCNHRIQIFSADGKFLRSHGHAGSGRGELSYPYDVRVDAAGRQYVCEFGNSRIQVFDADDQPLEILGGPGSAPGRLNNPWSLALDSAGNLYVADSLNHRVQKFVRREPDASRPKSQANAAGPETPKAAPLPRAPRRQT